MTPGTIVYAVHPITLAVEAAAVTYAGPTYADIDRRSSAFACRKRHLIGSLSLTSADAKARFLADLRWEVHAAELRLEATRAHLALAEKELRGGG